MHIHAAYSADLFYPLFLANGVTGIRDAGSPVPLDTLLQWRQAVLAGTRVGPPRQILSGQSIRGPAADCDRSQLLDNFQTCVADSADAVHYVDSLKAAGADMIKPREVDPSMYFILAAEARRVGLPFGGHTWDNIAIMASDSGARIIDHLHPWSGDFEVLAGLKERCWAGYYWPSRERRVDAEQCRPVAEQFKRNNTWVVPTLIVDKTFGNWQDATMTKKAEAILDRFAARADEFGGGRAASWKLAARFYSLRHLPDL